MPPVGRDPRIAEVARSLVQHLADGELESVPALHFVDDGQLGPVRLTSRPRARCRAPLEARHRRGAPAPAFPEKGDGGGRPPRTQDGELSPGGHGRADGSRRGRAASAPDSRGGRGTARARSCPPPSCTRWFDRRARSGRCRWPRCGRCAGGRRRSRRCGVPRPSRRRDAPSPRRAQRSRDEGGRAQERGGASALAVRSRPGSARWAPAPPFERRGELGGGGEPVGRQLLQRGEHGVLDLRRDRARAAAERAPASRSSPWRRSPARWGR